MTHIKSYICIKPIYKHLRHKVKQSVSISVKQIFLTILAYTLLGTVPTTSQAQIWNKILPTNSKSNIDNIALTKDAIPTFKKDIEYLSSNTTLGRKAGSKGEEVAGLYIEQRMSQIGLQPGNEKTYRQHFKFQNNRRLSRESVLIIGNTHVFIPEQAFPTAFSADKGEDNFVMPKSREPNAPWILPLYSNGNDAVNPTFNWEEEAYEKAKTAQRRGASTVIFYDEYGAVNKPSFKPSSNFEQLDIIVIILHKEAYEKHIKHMRVITPISINIDYTSDMLVGTNLVGYIDNKANKTIAITSYYDNIGETNNTNGVRYYPGADKGASSVAMMLALAERLKKYSTTEYNFIFVANSGHFNGATGSKAFLNQYKGDILMSFNLDAVGRLVSNNKLIIEGTGSSLIWQEHINSISSLLTISSNKNYTLPNEAIDFYYKRIPALVLTTGSKQDHETVGDIPNKINYEGMVETTNFLLKLIDKSVNNKVPLFTKLTQDV